MKLSIQSLLQIIGEEEETLGRKLEATQALLRARIRAGEFAHLPPAPKQDEQGAQHSPEWRARWDCTFVDKQIVLVDEFNLYINGGDQLVLQLDTPEAFVADADVDAQFIDGWYDGNYYGAAVDPDWWRKQPEVLEQVTAYCNSRLIDVDSLRGEDALTFIRFFPTSYHEDGRASDNRTFYVAGRCAPE